ncbi:hypothetical protein R3W88_016760 [Solanum pinnatisectum]|uniref:RHOMBOID-like protein n=1 Tax=Solanum pinnatisectum TaxID=50273 RepID=A0AAV9L2H2_9SOLN|nr:hypothetical protein R3W88_016760 [Solanum pinnatisectum]
MRNNNNNMNNVCYNLIFAAKYVMLGFVMNFFIHCQKQDSRCPNPLFGLSSSMKRLGALNWNKVVYHHQGWRLITCIWLHASLIHLLASTMGFMVVAKHLEQQYGSHFPHWYHIPILRNWGSILTSLFIQRSVSVGASGALFGLIGAKFSEIIANWSVSVAGMLPHVGNFAHIGGFMTGLLLGFVLLVPPHVGRAESDQNLPVVDYVYSKYKAYRNVFGLLSLILLVTGSV